MARMGESFWQFRRYQNEDAARIDWRQSAKSQHLYVREREWEAAQTVWFWRDASENMNFKSGAVSKRARADLLLLALASLPDYEPNARKLTTGDSIRNRMTQDVYELGSIFKIFAFTLAIEEKTVQLDELINVGKPLKLGNHYIHDFEHLGPLIPAARLGPIPTDGTNPTAGLT